MRSAKDAARAYQDRPRRTMLDVAYDNYLSDFYTVAQFEARVGYLLAEGIADAPWPTVPAAPPDRRMFASLQDWQRELRARAGSG